MQPQGLPMGDACNLPGCDKRISAPNRLACGELHHLLIMAQRYHNISNTPAGGPDSDSPSTSSSSHPDNALQEFPPQEGLHSLPQQAQLLLGFSQRQSEGLCALLPCSKPSAPPAHAWCSRRHYLEWLRAFYCSLVPDQICELRPECTRHVFVDIDVHTGAFHAHRFCGWTHCQEYQKRAALRDILPAPAPLPQLSTSDEGFYPREPSVESLIKTLINYSVFRMPPEGIKVVEDFYTKHPWEVLQHPEDGCCFLITRCRYKDKEQKRELTTKDQYHWKQNGRPLKVGVEANKKHFSYSKLQGRKRNSSKISNDNLFTMVEYSIVEGESYSKCKDYSLVRLSVSQAQTAARKRTRKEVQADEAESNTLPPDNAATVADQACDLYLCSEQGRDGNSLDASPYPLEAMPFTNDFNTGVTDLGISEGLDLSTIFRFDDFEAVDDYIHDSLSASRN